MTDISEIELLKAQAKAELQRLHAQSTAKEVAGKAIGEGGLFYITLIIAIGVGASLALEAVSYTHLTLPTKRIV